MSATFIDEGLQQLMNLVLGSGGSPTFKLKLFTNNHTPASGDTLGGSYTQCSLTGYAAITLAEGTWVQSLTGGVRLGTYPQQTFTFSAYGGGTTIYGYLVTITVSATEYALCAELLGSAFAVPAAGGSLLLTPTERLSQRGL